MPIDNNEAKSQDRFRQQMHAFDRWKAEVAHAIEEYLKWLTDHKLSTPETELRIHETLESLRSDRLTIAFVAEFSRGKTELINAIFFSDYQRRLLPSDVGRTTMCPTELFYDIKADKAYIQLLPIETRLKDMTINELKQKADEWTVLPLDINSPEQMANSLKEVVRVKQVKVETAKQLGLYNEELQTQLNNNVTPTSDVEIPVWRHAIISFPHPLLQQGLTILDTPGLNALGNEPELTMSMLPNAHAVLFVLAADTGVTRSDLDVWQYHVKASHNNAHKGLVAALNKIDALWDEMKKPEEIEASIDSQRKNTAKMLGIDTGSVFPISAQKGLVGKIRKDSAILQQSRLLDLENYLADNILPAKEHIVQETIVGGMDVMLKGTMGMISTRLDGTRKQLEELRSLSGRNTDAITNLTEKTRERQAAYNKNMESFQTSRKLLSESSKIMMTLLSIQAFDNIVGNTRKIMEGSWTTAGLKNGMKTFFDGMSSTMDKVMEQATKMHSTVQAIYQKFHDEHGLPMINPTKFSLDKYRAELNKLYNEAETFRNSPITTMTEQHFVVKKFFITLVSHVRYIFVRANKDTDAWLKEIMVPLVKHINDHKQQMDQHLETLCKINESRDVLEQKIKDTEKRAALLEYEAGNLKKIYQQLHTPMPIQPNPAGSAAVANRAAG